MRQVSVGMPRAGAARAAGTAGLKFDVPLKHSRAAPKRSSSAKACVGGLN